VCDEDAVAPATAPIEVRQWRVMQDLCRKAAIHSARSTAKNLSIGNEDCSKKRREDRTLVNEVRAGSFGVSSLNAKSGTLQINARAPGRRCTIEESEGVE
jgi:hypothetical protein